MKNFHYNFENQVVLVTGASKGLGYEISKSFIKSGSNLIICARNLNEIKKTTTKKKSIKKNVFFGSSRSIF